MLSRRQIGGLAVSRFVLGGNPFSGFSHQSPRRDREMVRYYTTARIMQTLGQAEELGIDTFLGRADRHIARTLLEHWDQGGTIQWFAQTCPEYASLRGNIDHAVGTGAKACYLHGGTMDHLLATKQLGEISSAVARIRDAGLAAGVAGHSPQVFHWAEQHLEVDFYMCSYYNPSSRERQADHVPGADERFAREDRDAMARTIQPLAKPAIHYKVLAAGRNDPCEAFAFVGRHLRPQDVVCVGVYTKDVPDMLEQDLLLFESSLGGRISG